MSPDWNQILEFGTKLIIAFLLAIPIGWDREVNFRNTGLRTFPIVAIASCGYILICLSVQAEGVYTIDLGRVFSGLVSGMGFIGGGAILKTDDSIKGLSTAASIWLTGTVGISVAFGRYDLAIICTIANFLVLRALKPIKQQLKQSE